MELKHLRSFIALADTLNFSRASEILFLSQPALSRQIQDLENELGVSLLTRTTRQVNLTPAGEEFRERAKDILSRIEKLPQGISQAQAREQPLKTLTIGVDARATQDPTRRKQITDSVFSLRRRHSSLRALFCYTDYQDITERLLAKTLDCALILDRETELPEGLTDCLLSHEEMVLAFRSKNKHTDQDYAQIIMNRGLIMVEREERGLYHIVQILSNLDLQPQIRFCSRLQDMTLTMATGESAAILPQSVICDIRDPDIQVLKLPTKYAQLNYSFLYREDTENSAVSDLLRELQAMEKPLQV